MELLGYPFKLASEERIIAQFIAGSTLLYISENIVNQTITIRKRHKIKLPDAIIAATAMEHSLNLLSRNITDFKNISGLTIINPWEL